jgi:hypothetical protein
VNNKFWNNNGLGSVGDGGPVFTTNPAPTISGNVSNQGALPAVPGWPIP